LYKLSKAVAVLIFHFYNGITYVSGQFAQVLDGVLFVHKILNSLKLSLVFCHRLNLWRHSQCVEVGKNDIQTMQEAYSVFSQAFFNIAGAVGNLEMFESYQYFHFKKIIKFGRHCKYYAAFHYLLTSRYSNVYNVPILTTKI